MDPYAVGFSISFLLGAAGGMAVMYVAFYDRITTVVRQPKRTRAKKSDAVEQELEETQAWLGVMQDSTADSLDLVRYRYKWGKNPLLAIGAAAQRLAIASKPHGQDHMASIAKHMKSRPKPITGRKVLAARRRQ